MTKKENATSAGNFGEYREDGGKNEAISLLSGNKSSTRTSRKQVIGSPEWYETWKHAQYAITWTEDNPDAWLHAFIEPMEQCKEQGRKFSIQTGVQTLQNVEYVGVDGRRSLISHTPARALGRIAAWQRPDLKGYITFSASRFDSDGLPWSPAPTVNPQPSLFDAAEVEVGAYDEDGGHGAA